MKRRQVKLEAQSPGRGHQPSSEPGVVRRRDLKPRQQRVRSLAEASSLPAPAPDAIARPTLEGISRLQAAEVLRKSEEKYRTLFNFIDEGFCIIEVLFDARQQPVDYCFLEVNPAFERLTGLRNATGHRVREFLPHLETSWFETFGRIVRTGHPMRWENRVAQLGRDFDVYAFRIGDPSQHTVAVLFTDITERRRTEAALRRSEASLAQALHVARLGTFEHDHLADVIEFSPLLRRLMGFAPKEVITLPGILGRVLPEEREGIAAAVRRAHDPAGDGQYEVEFRMNVRGHIRWFSVRSQTFFEGEGSQRRPLRTIGAVLDATERKTLELGLERMVAERTGKLRELVGELEHFSYTITHDMRAPLRAMRGYAELAERLLADVAQPKATELLRRIAVSADRMDGLIRDALSYNQAVRQELPLGWVDTGTLLHGMLESYPELQRVREHIRIEGELPPVRANTAGLTQCFSNLLGNAVKFVKPGELPRIRIRAEPAPTAGAPGAGPVVRLWVEDQGIGIPHELLPRIFEMFSRGQTTYEGTGIGLALVRKVMDRMGGRMGVESEEGKGSRFWLELPAADA